MLKKIIILIITLYQRTFSPDNGGYSTRRMPVCKMYPSCSQYTIEVIQKYGVIKGIIKAFLRIGRCNPWQKESIDRA
jgi:uncharacterized protein